MPYAHREHNWTAGRAYDLPRAAHEPNPNPVVPAEDHPPDSTHRSTARRPANGMSMTPQRLRAFVRGDRRADRGGGSADRPLEPRVEGTGKVSAQPHVPNTRRRFVPADLSDGASCRRVALPVRGQPVGQLETWPALVRDRPKQRSRNSINGEVNDAVVTGAAVAAAHRSDDRRAQLTEENLSHRPGLNSALAIRIRKDGTGAVAHPAPDQKPPSQRTPMTAFSLGTPARPVVREQQGTLVGPVPPVCIAPHPVPRVQCTGQQVEIEPRTVRYSGPWLRQALCGALELAKWSHVCFGLDDAGHRATSPRADHPTTAAELPRRLTVHPARAFGAARSSVAPGAHLAVASCFHTLVSPISRAAGLRGGTVRVARRMAVRNRVGGRGPGCSGRCTRC